MTAPKEKQFTGKYRSSREAESRILLLIDGFSRDARGERTLQGRVKLAKLDFFLRYPRYLARVLEGRGARADALQELRDADSPLESTMVRYRYGPWDPSYFAVLGSLIGRNLIEVVPAVGTSALGYRTTDRGRQLVRDLENDGAFFDLIARIRLIRRHLDLSGESLKRMVYDIPQVANARWFEELK
jgi:hypothetical protein